VLVFVVTGIPTWGTGGVPNALNTVERLMPNAGEAALILSSDFRNNLSQPSSPAQVVPTTPLR
jgi:hypothetical protein